MEIFEDQTAFIVFHNIAALAAPAASPHRPPACNYLIRRNIHRTKRLSDLQKSERSNSLFLYNVFKYFTASVAAVAPSDAAVTSWRTSLARLSPATNTPGVFVLQSSPDAA